MAVNLKDALATPLAGTVAQGLFSVGATRVQRKWSEKMYQKYNSPAALVQQYQDAGINPALMFGQSPIAAPTQSDVAATPDNAFGDVVGMLGSLMQLEMLDANKENIKADTRNKNASAVGQETENQFKPEILRQSIEKGKLDITQAQNAISRFEDELANLRADTTNKQAQANYAAASAMLALAQRALVGKQGEQIDLANAQTRFEQAFQDQFGFLPNQPIWNSVSGALGKLANLTAEGRANVQDLFHSLDGELESIGKTAGNFIWDNIKKVPENVKNKIDWLKYWSY